MEIVIVGAGPIGCYIAQLLLNLGIKARIMEEHQEVGMPVKCAGIVGRQVFEDTSFRISKSSIINQIDGALFFYQGDNFRIRREGVAYVIDREKFDKELSKGLEIEYERRLLAIEQRGKGYGLKTSKGEINAEIVIGADGARSRVRRFMRSNPEGVKEKNKHHKHQEDELKEGFKEGIKYYTGWQYRLKLAENFPSPHLVRVYLEENIPFFFWIIPESEEIIRVGVIAKEGRSQLNRFLAEEKIRGEIIDKLAGIIPLGMVPKIGANNLALVGDAACHIKPLTGGGIYYGLKAAEILVGCIRDNSLAEYERRWKRKYRREIRLGLGARKIYERLNKQGVKDIFYLFKENANFIEEVANFENHSLILREVFKKPRILIRASQVLGKNIGRVIGKN